MTYIKLSSSSDQESQTVIHQEEGPHPNLDLDHSKKNKRILVAWYLQSLDSVCYVVTSAHFVGNAKYLCCAIVLMF